MAADNPLVRLEALASALDAVAAAAATASPESVAACEPSLAAAVAGLPNSSELSRCKPTDVVRHLQRLELGLRRCRRLGAVIGELVTASLSAQGAAPAYAPAGVAVHGPRVGRLQVRA